MIRITTLSLLLMFSVAMAVHGDDTLDIEEPSAQQLLQRVHSTLPQEPVQVIGELIAKDKRGKIQTRRLLDFYMDLTSSTAVTSYVLSDAFGQEMQRIEITRPTNQPTIIRYYEEASSTSTEPTNLTAPIDKLDFSWSDLTFDYLWWTNATLHGYDKASGRDCYVLEVTPPDPDNTPCARLRLFIDRASNGLLRIESYDADDRLTKKVEVCSLRKIRDTFSIGDIEVRSYPARTKTRLRIRDIVIDEGKQDQPE